MTSRLHESIEPSKRPQRRMSTRMLTMVGPQQVGRAGRRAGLRISIGGP
jgi:hypothetical protein